MRRLFAIGLCLCCLPLSLCKPSVVIGCAAAPPRGYEVSIHEELALITWNPQTQIEHFVRVANFQTKAPDFGFLVPTPSEPTLTEVDAEMIAYTLREQTKAKVVWQKRYQGRFGLGEFPWTSFGADSAKRAPADTATPGGVEVLGEYRVAGYDAAVLRAEDASALQEWLDQHKYPTHDSLTDWLKIYTDQRWIITAFKLTQEGQAGRVKTGGVRISFKTETPFYPYREPVASQTKEDSQPNASQPRQLKVFLLTDARYQGRIGKDSVWPGRTVWSGPMEKHALSVLANEIKTDSAKLSDWLTEFVDPSSPRSGFDDLYFSKSASQQIVKRPDIVRYSTVVRYYPGWDGLGWGILATSLVAVYWAWLARQQRRAKGRNSAKFP